MNEQLNEYDHLPLFLQGAAVVSDS